MVAAAKHVVILAGSKFDFRAAALAVGELAADQRQFADFFIDTPLCFADPFLDRFQGCTCVVAVTYFAAAEYLQCGAAAVAGAVVHGGVKLHAAVAICLPGEAGTVATVFTEQEVTALGNAEFDVGAVCGAVGEYGVYLAGLHIQRGGVALAFFQAHGTLEQQLRGGVFVLDGFAVGRCLVGEVAFGGEGGDGEGGQNRQQGEFFHELFPFIGG